MITHTLTHRYTIPVAMNFIFDDDDDDDWDGQIKHIHIWMEEKYIPAHQEGTIIQFTFIYLIKII